MHSDSRFQAKCLTDICVIVMPIADWRRIGQKRDGEQDEAAVVEAAPAEDERTVRFPCHAAAYDPAWLVPYTLQVCF